MCFCPLCRWYLVNVRFSASGCFPVRAAIRELKHYYYYIITIITIITIRELKQATYLGQGRKQKVNTSHARTMVSRGFSN